MVWQDISLFDQLDKCILAAFLICKRALNGFSFIIMIKLHSSLSENLSCLTQLQQQQEQHYPFLPVLQCVQYFCVQTLVWLPVFRIFNMRTLMHVIAHWGCMNNVRESTLKMNSGEKIPCHTEESNAHHAL